MNKRFYRDLRCFLCSPFHIACSLEAVFRSAMWVDHILNNLWWNSWLQIPWFQRSVFQATQFWLDLTEYEHRPLFMRRFIRHPSSIPIEFQINDAAQADSSAQKRLLKNIGIGGLCFVSEKPLPHGSKIHIHIPLEFQSTQEGAFDADGYVAWCMRENENYTVGVEFNDHSSQFGVRMVEQVCHIEHYRANVKESEGRCLSSEEAAKEWIERYAATFPH